MHLQVANLSTHGSVGDSTSPSRGHFDRARRTGRGLGPRILLVEDNPGDAELVREQLLDDRGVVVREVVHVKRLGDAIHKLVRDRFDAVILDLGLPDSNGIGGVTQVLDVCPHVAVVVLTGNDDEITGLRAVQAGAQDYLRKGAYGRGLLIKSVLYAIERSRWQRQTQELITKNVDAMIVVIDGLVRFNNTAAETLFGVGRGELVGTPFRYPLDEPDGVQFELPSTADTGLRYVQLRATAIEWNGRPAHLASLRDVTELKRAQALEHRLLHAERLAVIGELAAGVAHEINNPLAFVTANLESLKDTLWCLSAGEAQLRDELTSEFGTEVGDALARWERQLERPALQDRAREIAADSMTGVQRISAIVRELSAFARKSDGDIELVDLNEVVAVAFKMTRGEIQRHAEYVEELRELPAIAGDRARLTQVLINLLMNAVHAVEDPGGERRGRIVVRTEHIDDRLSLVVEDSGCGMQADEQARIFEPFFTTKPRGRGTGLGLPISLEILRAHGGGIHVHSELGKGSRFEVRLPVITPFAAQLEQAGNGRSGPAVPLEPGRILIVDNEALLRTALRAILEPRGQTVVEAESGEQALAILEHDSQFDVIVCDILMSGVDGVDVYRHLERTQPQLLNRFVFVTGGAYSQATREFIAEVRPALLEKPFSSRQLESMLSWVRSQSRLRPS